MKKSHLIILAFGIFFLFLIQMAGSLVESIYILDLMNTSLDEKALGVLFFFSPVLLFFFRKKLPVQTAWILFGLLFRSRPHTLSEYPGTYASFRDRYRYWIDAVSLPDDRQRKR